MTRKLKAPTSTGLQEFIGLRDLAAHFKVSTRTVLRWIARGTVPEPIRAPGRLVRWSVDELNTWIEAGCPSAEQD